MKIVRLLLLILISNPLFAQPGKQAGGVLLPTGWSLSPAGKSFPLGDLPLNIAVSSDQKFLAVTNNGQSIQSLQLVNARKGKLLHSIEVPIAWVGLAFASDSRTLYVSGGNDNTILRYRIEKKRLVLQDTFTLGKPWPERISPAGLCVDDARGLLYVVTKENHSLYVIDIRSKAIVHQEAIGKELYTCALAPGGRKLYLSHWGGDELVEWDTENRKVTARIPVGDNPNDFVISRSGQFAFVACANDNTVSIVDLRQGKTIEILVASLFPDAPAGSTTNGVALSPDETRLYVANADNNCLAVFNVSTPGQSRPEGFIPTGWYPTCVRAPGKQIFVSNGKGFSSMPNPKGPDPTSKEQRVAYQEGNREVLSQIQYIGGLFKGTMSVIPAPNERQIEAYSRQVYSNSPYTKAREMQAEGEPGNPIPQKLGDFTPIKYVFYVIKENRTYDQVLGDLPEGNRDSTLCLFPEKITPNHHALAREFVLFDNFYVSAEVSADGHNWSTAGYANDFVEKTWVSSYGRRGGNYVYEGQNPLTWPKKGFIWDYCQRAGVSYRTYGEFADDGKANIPALEDHFCPYYTGWDTSVKDITRIEQWKQDFDSLVQVNAVPQFNSIRLINDHTEGLRLGKPTPFAQMADNDLALGLLVEHISHSPIWPQAAIFVLEDDAQNGADHVDAHRSIAYVISPFARRKFVDHTMYSTNSMLRTIELILGLPPMSQQNAAATPLWRSFNSIANLSPYKALPSNVNLDELNVAEHDLQRLFETFDMSAEDRAPDLEFNQALWKAIKGEHSEMPAPRRAAFLKYEAED